LALSTHTVTPLGAPSGGARLYCTSEGKLGVQNSGSSTQGFLVSTLDSAIVTNAMLANSSITVNGSAIRLGGAVSNLQTTNGTLALAGFSSITGTLSLAGIAQGDATTGQYLQWSGSAWAPVTLSTGLTINTTAITGGTSGYVLYDNAGVLGKIAATDASTASTIVKRDSSGNASFASVNASGGFYGNGFTAGYFANGYLAIIVDAARITMGAYNDIALSRNGYGILRQDYGVSAANFMVCNTFTSTTNWEAGVFDWQTSSNTLRLGSDKGAVGGSARDVTLIRGGTAMFSLLSTGLKVETGYIAISDTSAPGGTPSGGGYLYVESGALKYKGSSGTVTTIANA
jgi:hypothetical protein